MNYQWNLDRIYKGFEDPAYTADMERMQQLVKEFTAFAESLPTIDPLEGLKTGVALREKLSELSSLFQYQFQPPESSEPVSEPFEDSPWDSYCSISSLP